MSISCYATLAYRFLMLRLYILGLALALMTACEQPEDDPEPTQAPAAPADSTQSPADDAEEETPSPEQILVLNEGQFQRANASIGRYELQERVYRNAVFQNASGVPLGDVLQSAHLAYGRLFLCLNNSRRIWVIDTATSQAVRSIDGVPYPQALWALDGQKAYATDLYRSFLYIIDWKEGRVQDSIDLKSPSWPMLQAGKYLFVGLRPVSLGGSIPESETNAIAVIDTETDALVAKVSVPDYPQQLVRGPEGFIWVGCSGQSSQLGAEEPAGVAKMSAQPPFEVVEQWTYDDAGLSDFQWNAGQSTWMWLRKGAVHRSKPAGFSLSETPWLKLDRVQTVAGLGTLPNGGVLIGDALDYVQPGWVYHYDHEGWLVNRFRAGVIPKGFLTL